MAKIIKMTPELREECRIAFQAEFEKALAQTKFADGIKKTIDWYLENREWWEEIISGEYQNY